MAEKAANSMFADIQRDWTESTQSTFGQQQQAEQPQIDWANFNYPPLIRLFHFDLAELPARTRVIVRWIHISFLIALVIMIVNFIDNVVLAALGLKGGWWNLAYSLLNIMIGAPLGCFVFYTGYKGLAKNESKEQFRYVVMESALIAAYVIFALIPFGPFNGLIAFAMMGTDRLYHFESGGAKGFAIFVIALESIGWLLSAAIAALCTWKVKTFNPYLEGQDSRNVRVNH